MAMWTRSRTRAMTTIAHLPRDVVIFILLRLPIKVLLQCLSVCRSFEAIIRSQEFLDLHLKRQQDQIFVYHYPHKKGPDPIYDPCIMTKDSKNHYSFHDQTFFTSFYAEFPEVDDTNDARRVTLGCCKGLICLVKYNIVYFWNPAIRVSKNVNWLYRESDASSSWIDFGYGFVPQINDFKLVRLKRYRVAGAGKIPHEVDVYTLSSNSWRRIENNVSGTIKYAFQTACVNGVIYWHATVSSEGTSSDVEVYNYILGFSLHDEVFHEITLPEKNLSNFIVWEYKDCLCMSTFGSDVSVIWMKKDQGTAADSWVKLHTFEEKQPGPATQYGPQMLTTGELLVPRNGGTFLVCDPKNGQIKKHLPALKNVGFPENDRYHLHVMNYRESLVLLKPSEVIPKEEIKSSMKKRTGLPQKKQQKKLKRSRR